MPGASLMPRRAHLYAESADGYPLSATVALNTRAALRDCEFRNCELRSAMSGHRSPHRNRH